MKNTLQGNENPNRNITINIFFWHLSIFLLTSLLTSKNSKFEYFEKFQNLQFWNPPKIWNSRESYRFLYLRYICLFIIRYFIQQKYLQVIKEKCTKNSTCGENKQFHQSKKINKIHKNRKNLENSRDQCINQKRQFEKFPKLCQNRKMWKYPKKKNTTSKKMYTCIFPLALLISTKISPQFCGFFFKLNVYEVFEIYFSFIFL